MLLLDPPLSAEKYKELYNKMHYGMKSNKPETREAAEAAQATWDNADHETRSQILEQSANHKDLKFVAGFKTRKEESFEKKSDHVDAWMDKLAINKFLNYPAELLDQYVSQLPSRDHEDTNSHALGLKQYHFIHDGVEVGTTSEKESRALECDFPETSPQR
jgi:hypothetical protein